MTQDIRRVGSIRMLASTSFDRVPVDVRVARHKAESPVEPVGRLSRRPRTEFYGTRSTLCGDSESLATECLSHAPPARSLIDSHVFDPCSNPCRNAKHDEGQHPDDLATPGTIACQQQRGA